MSDPFQPVGNFGRLIHRNKYATTRSNFWWEEIFSIRSIIALSFPFAASVKVFFFFSNASSSGESWKWVLLGHKAGSSRRNYGPLNHIELFNSFTLQSRDTWPAGFCFFGTCRLCTLSVNSWISDTLFATKVCNVNGCVLTQCNTISESVQNVIFSNRRLNIGATRDHNLARRCAAESSRRGRDLVFSHSRLCSKQYTLDTTSRLASYVYAASVRSYWSIGEAMYLADSTRL